MAISIRNKAKYYLDSSFIVHNAGGLSNYILHDWGIDDSSVYLRFENGIMITFKEKDITIPCNEAWGNLFVGNYDELIYFPKPFYEKPMVQTDVEIVTGACFKLEWEKPVITTTAYKNIGIARGSSSGAVNFKAKIFAIGKWK